MGTVYAITNQKGGVGKTTTAVNVAACIAEAGPPTLLVDIDPQANATVGLGFSKGLQPNAYDVLLGEACADDALVATTIAGLTLLPSSPSTLLRFPLTPYHPPHSFSLLSRLRFFASRRSCSAATPSTCSNARPATVA